MEHDQAHRVICARSMGIARGLDSLPDAAALVAGEPGIVFLFVGEVVSRDGLRCEAAVGSSVSPRYAAHQPTSGSDLCVVSRTADMVADSVQSKPLRIQACGRSIQAIAGADSIRARKVYASGEAVAEPSSSTALAKRIRALRAAPRSPSGMRARS